MKHEVALSPLRREGCGGRLVLVSEVGCVQTLTSIAELLEKQSDSAWLWLIVCDQLPLELEQNERTRCLGCIEEAGPWLQSEQCVAWIRLETPCILADRCALEKVRWCLRSYLQAPFIAYVDVRTSEYRLRAVSQRPSSGSYWLRGRGGAELPSVAERWSGRCMLMLLPWLEPGGADRCNLDIIRSLATQGWYVCVVASLEARHAWQARFQELANEVLVLPHFISAERALEFLLACLESRQPDVLFSSNCRLAYDVLPIIRTSYPQLPVVALNHMEEAWAEGGYPGLAVRAGTAIDRHWTVSDHLRRWLVDHGAEAARVRTLHWFADTTRWAPCLYSRRRFRQRFNIPDELPVIVFAGRLCRQKRPDILVRSLSILADSGQEFAALIVGDGELLPALHRSIRQRGLQRCVHYLGWQDEDGLRDAFRASDLLFLPSDAEGIALVLYEAMACGLAVLASSVGGQAELVSNDCGRLIAPENEEDFALALQELLAVPEKLRQMGLAARSRMLGQFDEGSFSRRLEQLLADVEFKPWSRLPEPSGRPIRALVRLQWQWSMHRLLVRFNQERLASVPLIGRPLSLVLKAVLYAGIWSIGMYRWGRGTAP